MSWRRRRDDDIERWKKMFPWLPSEMFENFFQDDFLSQMMEEIERMMEGAALGDEELAKKKLGPFVWGWHMSVGPDGKPDVKQFGNVRPSRKGRPIPSKDREPLVDVFIEDKVVRVIAELPGVSKNDINVKATESKVIISAKSDERNYSAERELSVKIKPKTASAVYKNGILELTVDRKEPEIGEEGFEIKIE
ncbi:MAG: Hsp20 family protein [Candidatus Heimdallarchaeota archaeon]|nr:Hsp20 family protein [Candidatus Heimdallarchaeota archaeon]